MASSEDEATGRAIDQLLTVDFDQRGIVGELYDAAYAHHGRSLNMLAAEELLNDVSEGDDVLIITGFPVGPTDAQETDGPIGAASLARTMKMGLGAHPTIIAEEGAVPTIEAAARAYGLHAVSPDTRGETRAGDWTCTVDSFPTDRDEADARADRLLDDLDPSAVVAIERCSAAEDGEYHRATGEPVTDACIKPEPLFERTDALTVGVGDGGNELGTGTISEATKRAVPHGEEIASATDADVTVITTVSNHAGPGITAALSVLLDRNLLHTPETEERALVQHAQSGAIDGVTGRTDGSVDGLSPTTHAGVVEILHAIVEESSFSDEFRE
jgi:hypothetical protein